MDKEKMNRINKGTRRKKKELSERKEYLGCSSTLLSGSGICLPAMQQ